MTKNDPESTSTPSSTPMLYTLAEATAILRISRWTLHRLIQERRLHTIKIGTRRLVPPEAIRDFITKSAAEGDSGGY